MCGGGGPRLTKKNHLKDSHASVMSQNATLRSKSCKLIAFFRLHFEFFDNLFVRKEAGVEVNDFPAPSIVTVVFVTATHVCQIKSAQNIEKLNSENSYFYKYASSNSECEKSEYLNV